jgi:hypothetical protein
MCAKTAYIDSVTVRTTTMDIFADQGKVRAIYHVSVGVSDIERARRFYGASLSPLGYKLLYEVKEAGKITSSAGVCTTQSFGPTYPWAAERRTRAAVSTSRCSLQMPARWIDSTPQLCRSAGPIMGRRAIGPTTIPVITVRSYWIQIETS